MKPGQNVKQRPRGRNISSGSKGRPPSRNTTFDSNGPEIRVRGNAHQVLEKYLGLARDASSQGDRIAAENYYQHAEHYFRVINNQNQHNANRNGVNPVSTPADDRPMMSGNESDNDGNENENEMNVVDGDDEIEETGKEALSA